MVNLAPHLKKQLGSKLKRMQQSLNEIMWNHVCSITSLTCPCKEFLLLLLVLDALEQEVVTSLAQVAQKLVHFLVADRWPTRCSQKVHKVNDSWESESYSCSKGRKGLKSNANSLLLFVLLAHTLVARVTAWWIYVHCIVFQVNCPMKKQSHAMMLVLKLWHNAIWPAMLCVGMHVPQCSRTTCLLLGPSHWSCGAHTLSFTATLHSCSTAWLKQQLLETFLLTTNAEKTLEGFIYLEQTAVLKKPQTGYQQKQTKGYDW